MRLGSREIDCPLEWADDKEAKTAPAGCTKPAGLFEARQLLAQRLDVLFVQDSLSLELLRALPGSQVAGRAGGARRLVVRQRLAGLGQQLLFRRQLAFQDAAPRFVPLFLGFAVHPGKTGRGS